MIKNKNINDQDFTPLACHRTVQTFLVKNIKTDMKKDMKKEGWIFNNTKTACQ